MSWYIAVLKKYAVFSGRARRKEYWMFFLCNVVVAMVWGFIVGLIAGMMNEPGILLLTQLYTLGTLIPSIAVAVRRMHDSGHSGWWILCPLVNIVFLFLDSQADSNEYGPNPKLEGAMA